MLQKYFEAVRVSSRRNPVHRRFDTERTFPGRAAILDEFLSAPEGEGRNGTINTEPFRPRLSCSRLVGGLELERAFVPFICKLTVGNYAQDAQPGEFVLVVRPREQQGRPCQTSVGGAQEELPRSRNVASLEFTFATGDHLGEAFPVGR